MSILELPPWKIDFLQSLDWRLFETLCAKVFEAAGYQATETNDGPDGGIDIHLRMGNDPSGDIAVQCKRQKKPIETSQVREFYGAAKQSGASRAIFVTTGSFDQRSLDEFQDCGDLCLIDGNQFIEGIHELGRGTADNFMKFILGQPEWSIPTCPKCTTKMIRRVNKESNEAFWGCENFSRKNGPACRMTFPVG